MEKIYDGMIIKEERTDLSAGTQLLFPDMSMYIILDKFDADRGGYPAVEYGYDEDGSEPYINDLVDKICFTPADLIGVEVLADDPRFFEKVIGGSKTL